MSSLSRFQMCTKNTRAQITWIRLPGMSAQRSRRTAPHRHQRALLGAKSAAIYNQTPAGFSGAPTLLFKKKNSSTFFLCFFLKMEMSACCPPPFPVLSHSPLNATKRSHLCISNNNWPLPSCARTMGAKKKSHQQNTTSVIFESTRFH